jgi:hypothetical protein
VGVVDNTIDDGGQVPADRYDQSASWKLFSTEVYRATLPDVHSRGPNPSQIQQVAFVGTAVNACA